MKIFKSALIAASLLAATGAKATIIDFTAMADAYEHGASSLFYSYADFDLTVTGWIASSPTTPAFAYLDSGHAGLGVCGALNSGLQCNPSSDDNVTGATAGNEVLTFAFSDITAGLAINIDNLWLNNSHDPNPGGQITADETVSLNGVSTAGPGNGYATGSAYNSQANLNASAGNSLKNIALTSNAFTIGYDGPNQTAEQFYVSAVEISTFDVPQEVPVPGSLLLLGIGLVGLGSCRRKGAVA